MHIFFTIDFKKTHIFMSLFSFIGLEMSNSQVAWMAESRKSGITKWTSCVNYGSSFNKTVYTLEQYRFYPLFALIPKITPPPFNSVQPKNAQSISKKLSYKKKKTFIHGKNLPKELNIYHGQYLCIHGKQARITFTLWIQSNKWPNKFSW